MQRHIALAMVAFTLACGTASPDELSFVEKDSAGIHVIHNTSRGKDSTVALREVFRLGRPDGNDPELFFAINDVGISDSGMLAVGNAGSGSVRLFSLAGEFIREIGRSGSGPGEFDLLGEVVIWRDTIYAADARNGTAAFFSMSGELLKTARTVLSDGSAISLQAGSDRGWLATQQRFARRRPPAAGEVVEDSIKLVIVSAAISRHADGAQAGLADSVIVLATYAGARRFGVPFRESVISRQPLFEPQPTHAFDHTAVYLARGWPYVIDVLDLEGRHIRRITRWIPSVEISDGHIAALLERARAFYDSIEPGNRRSIDELVARATLPRIGYLPQTGRMLVDPGRSLWVQRLDMLQDPLDHELRRVRREPLSSHWDVFDGVGRYQHAVAMPAGFVPFEIRSGLVVGVIRDADDVEYVVGYEVAEKR